ncbi:unnamed protein product, partial [Ixodes hexagonus]
GFGYADVENRVPCGRHTLMRIGSISKPIAMMALAKLMEQGKVDLDKPIQEYVPSFPQKTYNGKPDTAAEEFYLNRKFKTVEEALELFKNDDLLSEPGTKYLYTTFGWTLISAAIEGASKESFRKHLYKMLRTIGMKNTLLDENEPIVYHRSRCYMRDKEGRLANSPCVDNSYKWAGGGLLSDVDDLVLFGNAMLYSVQADPSSSSCKRGYLLPETVRTLWTPPESASGMWSRTGRYDYAMGWTLVGREVPEYGGCAERPAFVAYHTGGSVGATSALVLLPSEARGVRGCWSDGPPHGVVVAVAGNMNDAGYGDAALSMAREFAKLAS